ncbi:MAG: ribonuclease P protein component [Pseudomonadota bacterium]
MATAPTRPSDSPTIETLKKRADFLALRGAPGKGAPSFLLVARARDDGDDAIRVGYTVTKKMGGAVRRNRIKRRLKEAARRAFAEYGVKGCDYVLIARPKALTRNFTELLDDMKRALLSLRANPK